jgi:hypothetical protein
MVPMNIETVLCPKIAAPGEQHPARAVKRAEQCEERDGEKPRLAQRPERGARHGNLRQRQRQNAGAIVAANQLGVNWRITSRG